MARNSEYQGSRAMIYTVASSYLSLKEQYVAFPQLQGCNSEMTIFAFSGLETSKQFHVKKSNRTKTLLYFMDLTLLWTEVHSLFVR